MISPAIAWQRYVHIGYEDDLVTVDELNRVHEMAPVAWDRDIAPFLSLPAPLGLPMDPLPRCYQGLEHYNRRTILVFGGINSNWVAVAIWLEDRWDVRRRRDEHRRPHLYDALYHYTNDDWWIRNC